MRTHRVEETVWTPEPPGLCDVTARVRRVLETSGVRDGHVMVFIADPWCALVVNELESGLTSDLQRVIARARKEDRLPLLLGSASLVLPAAAGKLRLGTWQRVLLVELEKGCERSLVVQIVGE